VDPVQDRTRTTGSVANLITRPQRRVPLSVQSLMYTGSKLVIMLLPVSNDFLSLENYSVFHRQGLISGSVGHASSCFPDWQYDACITFLLNTLYMPAAHKRETKYM
jgi:hypothetical protein